MSFPTINPIALSIGPIHIHWYGIAYCIGILCGYQLAKQCVKKVQFPINLSDFASTIAIGIIIGGRLGYVLFYEPLYYAEHLIEIFALWKGGMSFHGGALGAFIATILTCKKHGLSSHKGLDILALCATPGLCFGRIANFINGELYGRITSAPWGMVFPNGGPLLRHPSQLYEAFFEGIILFIILAIIFQKYYAQGRIFSVFVIGYGMIRFVLEFTREPDAQLGLLTLQLSMGQYLSIGMIALGVLWTYARNKQFIH